MPGHFYQRAGRLIWKGLLVLASASDVTGKTNLDLDPGNWSVLPAQ